MKISKGDKRKAVITYTNMLDMEHNEIKEVEVIQVRGILFKDYLVQIDDGKVTYIDKNKFLR